MIVELTIENLALIERATLAFGPGFTAITGETGAGKSLLVDALELAFGARSDSEIVRTGSARAFIQVVIDLSDQPTLAHQCAELGHAPEEGLLYLQREIAFEGRSQGRINGKLCPIGALKSIGDLAIDLHGQHDHQSLLHPERHIEFLDSWAGKPAESALEKVRQEFLGFAELNRRHQLLTQSSRERAHRADLLTFQIQEIRAVSPVAGELDALLTQAHRLKHAERLAQLTTKSLELLAWDDNSASSRIASSLDLIREAASLDPSLQNLAAELETSLYQLEDSATILRTYSESIESNSGLLDEVQDRIEALRKLLKKYGESEDAVLLHLAQAESDLDALQMDESDLALLEERLEAARQKLDSAGAELSEVRKRAAKSFSEGIASQLRDLDMSRAEFEVSFRSRVCDMNGADEVEFLFSANLGETPRPLARIASGGELSRVMLAIRVLMAGKLGVPTLVFDEVDVGLGGKAAAMVAKKLEELSATDQVIVISHLPQIASRASAHFHISKNESADRVTTSVESLDLGRRVDEIARMIAGEHVTDTAVEHARQMLGMKLR